MIDIIIEALNEHSKDTFYVLHKYTKNSIVKSCKIDIFTLYSIKDDKQKELFTYSRTRIIGNSFESSEREATKQLVLFLLQNEQVSN